MGEVGKMCVLFYIATLMQTAISALQSVLQEDFKATEIEVLTFAILNSILINHSAEKMLISNILCIYF